MLRQTLDRHDTGGHGRPKERPVEDSIEQHRLSVLTAAEQQVDTTYHRVFDPNTVSFLPVPPEIAEVSEGPVPAHIAANAGHTLLHQ